MTTTTRISATSSTGTAHAAVINGSQKWAVLFNEKETRASAYSYALSFTGAVKHLLTDLQAGTYEARQGGTVIASFIAQDDGTGFFNSTGGGTFEVTRAGAVPIDTSPPAPPTGLIAH
jgi:hypothetical protein